MFFFLSFFSFSLFLSFSGLTLFVKTTERTVTECLKFSLSRKRLAQAFRRLSATRLSYNKTIQLYYPSSCICSPRSIVNGTIDRARFGKKKKRWNIQFDRYSVPSSYKDSISFLINQFHCDIFEGSYPRREFKSVKDISFDAGEIDGKGIGRMIYGNDFSTCLFLIYYTREMCPLQYRISLGDLWKEMKFKLRYFRL